MIEITYILLGVIILILTLLLAWQNLKNSTDFSSIKKEDIEKLDKIKGKTLTPLILSERIS